MKVSELIERLKTFPQEMPVKVTDSSCCGCGCGYINFVQIENDYVFIDGDRAHGLPNSENKP